MKQTKGISPYPILQKEAVDFETSTFFVDITSRQKPHAIELSGSILLQNPQIEEDIKNKKLKYVVHIECPVTAYRKMEEICGTSFTLDIPVKSVKKQIELRIFIVVNTPDGYIYQNQDFSKEFKGETFFLEKGNMIADWGSVIDITGEEELEAFPSVIKIQESNSLKNQFSVDLENENILVSMDKELVKSYQILGDRWYRETVLSLLMIPVLQQLIFSIREMGVEQYKDRHWYEVLSNCLKEKGIDIEEYIGDKDVSAHDVLIKVQEMLDNPLKKAFDELGKGRGDE